MFEPRLKTMLAAFHPNSAKARYLPVAVATCLLRLAIAVFCTLNTLASALAMVPCSALIWLKALSCAWLLTAACDAASPTRVWDARCAEMFERALSWALLAAALAALAIDAAI